jgi:hypothetical protein
MTADEIEKFIRMGQHFSREEANALSGQLHEVREQLASERELNRQLWVAISRLQQAVGQANGWALTGHLPDAEDGGYSEFNGHMAHADKILDGIISLTPEERP